MPLTVNVEVPPRDREVLASWVRSPSIRAGLAQRARVVLLAAGGGEGVGGLKDRPKPGKPRTTDDVAVVLATLEPPPARLGGTHWSSPIWASRAPPMTWRWCWPRWSRRRPGWG